MKKAEKLLGSEIVVRCLEELGVEHVFSFPGGVVIPLFDAQMCIRDSYKSMEFVGEGVSSLTMDDRFTIANMAIEAGGKNGIFPVDDKTIEYMKEHSTKEYKAFEADADAEYDAVYDISLADIKSTVAFPHLPENTKTVDEITEPVKIDQVVIGSCTCLLYTSRCV